jgi:phosphatidylinositol glycan class U
MKIFHKDAKQITLKKEEVAKVPQYVRAAYLLNPYIVCSCVAMTTTVFANLILSLTLLTMAKKSRVLSTFCLALSSHQSFYPVMLMVPIIIATAREKQLFKSIILTISSYAFFTALLLGFSYHSTGSWRFIESTYGCMLVTY